MRRYALSLFLLAGLSTMAAPVGLAERPLTKPSLESTAPAIMAIGQSAGAVPEGFDAAHAAYLSDSSLQLERPQQQIDADEMPIRSPPGWLRSLAAFLESLGPFFRVLFYLILAGIVMAFLWFAFGEAIRMRLGWKKKDKSNGTEAIDLTYRPERAKARSLLDEADRLAAEGRFAEAVHLLLFRSIEDLQARLSGGVPDSFTAREIARLSQLPGSMRQALLPIIKVVEQSFFGGLPVDKSGWEEARDSYERFAFGGV